MTFRHTKLFVGLLAATAMMQSCVDNDYDLSDIDTTVRVNVNNLTVPINLDEILLKSILKESDEIKIVDGQYLITEDGSFASSSVEIGAVNIQSQNFTPTELTLPYVPGAIQPGMAGSFSIAADPQQYKFDATNIPEEITDVKELGGELSFVYDFKFQGLSAIAKKVTLTDLVFQLPKGLHLTEDGGGAYDPESGELALPNIELIGESYTLVLTADKIDMVTLGAKLDYESHTLNVSGDFYVKAGFITLASDDIVAGATPTNIKLTINYTIPSFPVKTFSGNVKYDITGVDISDVDLSDLPDVLAQEGTDIIIANPCIYLSITNPIAKYNMFAETGMTLTAVRESGSKPYSVNPFRIEGPHPVLCLSPKEPTKYPADFANAIHVPFESLSNVLSGNGLPNSLSIKLDNPRLPDQEVIDLPLGTPIGSVEGSYSFEAPIALGKGSKIVYSGEADDWGSDDLDNLTITELHVKATLTSDIPLALDITAYPIDKDGNRINNVEIKGVKLNAGSDPQDVDIYITGAIRGLNGIHYEAVATAGEDENVLNENMHIRVTNLRPTVSGYYEKEL